MSSEEAREAAAGSETGSGSGSGSGSDTETGSSETGSDTDTDTDTDTETGSGTDTDAGKPARKPLKEKLEHLIAEYGTVAFVIYFSISLFTFVGLYIAIKAGIEVETSSAGKSAGTLMAAWLAYKLTMPVRILVALVLTPIVGRFVHRWRHPNE